MTDTAQAIARHEAYLAARTSPYRRRRARYAQAAGRLHDGGLDHHHTLVDVAAGWTELDYYLRIELGWRGRYIPVDGAIDGVDLEHWIPPWPRDWFVALEILEHLGDPERLALALLACSQRGVVITTPNPDVVDVRAMDPTHITPIPADRLRRWGFTVEPAALYGTPDDGLVAWHHHQSPTRRRPAP